MQNSTYSSTLLCLCTKHYSDNDQKIQKILLDNAKRFTDMHLLMNAQQFLW